MKGIGLQADVDVLPLSIEFQRAEAMLLQAERILEGRRRQLAATIGLPNLPIQRVEGRLDSQFPQINEPALREFVATRHPRILTASAEVDRRLILLRGPRSNRSRILIPALPPPGGQPLSRRSSGTTFSSTFRSGT